MISDQLDGVTVFLAVAESSSFTAAANRLDVSPTAISKAIRLMEARHGVALFQRTTRRVALTEAGRTAFDRLKPAATEIADALAALGEFRQKPTGLLRITAPRNAAVDAMLVAIAPAFRAAHPDVTLEISLDDAIVDLVAAGFDAGIRLGESIEKDMVAVRLTSEITWSVVGSPSYFARAGKPKAPEELVGHEAIRYRFITSQTLHRWGFERGRRKYEVDVTGGLIVNDRRLLVELAVKGLGLAFVSNTEAATQLSAGLLEPTLQSFIPRDSGLYLYFPARSQAQLKLRAFIDTSLLSTGQSQHRTV